MRCFELVILRRGSSLCSMEEVLNRTTWVPGSTVSLSCRAFTYSRERQDSGHSLLPSQSRCVLWTSSGLSAQSQWFGGSLSGRAVDFPSCFFLGFQWLGQRFHCGRRAWKRPHLAWTFSKPPPCHPPSVEGTWVGTLYPPAASHLSGIPPKLAHLDSGICIRCRSVSWEKTIHLVPLYLSIPL